MKNKVIGYISIGLIIAIFIITIIKLISLFIPNKNYTYGLNGELGNSSYCFDEKCLIDGSMRFVDYYYIED